MGGAVDHGITGPEAPALLEESIGLAVSGESHHAKPVGMTRDDVERIDADRTGCPKHRNILLDECHATSCAITGIRFQPKVAWRSGCRSDRARRRAPATTAPNL